MRTWQGMETMDHTQATQIRTLLLEAADAIDRASAIVSTLDSEDRAMISAALDEISSALHFEVLQKLYLRYPGLSEDGTSYELSANRRPGLRRDDENRAATDLTSPTTACRRSNWRGIFRRIAV